MHFVERLEESEMGDGVREALRFYVHVMVNVEKLAPLLGTEYAAQ